MLLVLALTPVHAQDTLDQDEPVITEQAQDPAEATARRERAADMRDAINENLVSPVAEDEAVEEEEKEKSTFDAPAESVVTPEAAEETEYWYTRFETVTEFVTTVPDRVPLLRGRNWVHFGRAEAEYGHFFNGTLDDNSGFNLRSLRGGIIRQLNERATVKLEIDLTDGDSNWADLWGRFDTRLGVFTVGHQRVAQTLINQTSRLSRTFQEVPLPADAFGLGRRLGVGWDFHLQKVGAHLTAFGRDLNENIGDFGYGLRAYTNPTKTRFAMFHIGLSAIREKMDRDARFRAYPETRVSDLRLVDTGIQPNVDTQSIYGIEAAGAQGPWSVRSEYFRANWDRNDQPDTEFKGFYVEGSWVITGESFRYAQGKFLRIRPESPRGAWEVALRYSGIDLTDDDVRGGRQRNASLGLNWYGPGRQLRVQGMFIHFKTDPDAGSHSSNIAQIRVQVHW